MTHKTGCTKLDAQNWMHKTGHTKLDTQNWTHKTGCKKLDAQNWMHKTRPVAFFNQSAHGEVSKYPDLTRLALPSPSSNAIIYSPQDIAILDNLIGSLYILEAYEAMYHYYLNLEAR